ncbi:hypothetical protein ACA910_003105 [Epithemia clementina (nom. ined.)]
MVIQGVIRPPPEIRAVADRTALYVAKNGRGFEVRILNSEKGKTPKFAFLQPNNPFHAYYEQRISFYENGGKDDDPQDESSDPVKRSQEKEQSGSAEDEKSLDKKSAERKRGKLVTSVGDPVSKAIFAQRNKIAQIRASLHNDAEGEKLEEAKEDSNLPGITMVPPPPPLHFISIVASLSLTVSQIETIQLVAQMTALDGKGGGFLPSLTLREWKNPEFAFCQPRNGLFPYFSALVDAYTKVLALQTGSHSEKKSIIGEYTTTELADNLGKCLEVAAYRAEYERDQAEHRRKDGNATSAAALVDWHDFVVVETIDFPVDEKVLTLPPPPPPTASLGSGKSNNLTGIQRDDNMDEDSGDEEQIRVVPSYTPKVVSSQLSSATDMVIDPITGRSVPIKDMPEHMRIQLLDPKWAEERKKFQEKQKESNLVEGDVVASNLARFAQARGLDSEDALSRENAQKRLKDANRVLREQSLHASKSVGPSLPESITAAIHQPNFKKPNHPSPFDSSMLPPEPKKARVDAAAPPNPTPPIPTTYAKAPPTVEVQRGGSSDTFAAVGEAEAQPAATSAANSIPSATDPSELIPEAVFAQSLPRPNVTLQIRVPNDPAQMAWNFYGQIVSLSIDVMTKVKAVKQELSRLHLNNMPANKVQLKSAEKGVFLKDNLSLAALNIGPTATLELIPKTRGGRK